MSFIIDPFRFAAPPAPGHRYWRITNIVTPTGNEFAQYELQLWQDASTRADSGITPTSSAGLFLGTPARLTDGDVNSLRVHFFPWSTSETIVWDFGSDVSITGFKRSDYQSNYAPSTIRLQYSDDNSSWTTFGNASGLTLNIGTLTAFIPFV